jgi:hypothetical protein
VIYNIVFPCLWRGIRCLCGNLWILAAPRSLEFWHLRAVINLARVQETRRTYKSQWKGQVKTSYKCLRMRTTQGPLWLSCPVQASLREMEWHVYVRTVENSKFFLNSQCGDVRAISTLLKSLSPYSEVYGRDPCTLRDLVCRSNNKL